MENKNQTYYPMLDYLRLAAVFSVIFYHSPFVDPHGYLIKISRFGALGVDLFFVLSGFLIANQLFVKLIQNKKFSLKEFYLKRGFRIWPNYFFLLGLFLTLGLIFPINDYQIHPLAYYLTLTQNYIVVNFFKVSWSLCIEEHFYLLFPLFLVLCLKFKLNRSHVVGLFLVFFLIGIGFRAYNWTLFRPDLNYSHDIFYEYFYTKTHLRLDGLLIGVGVAALKNYHEKWWSFISKNSFFILLLSPIVLISAISLLPKLGGVHGFASIVFSNLLTALAFGMMVVSCINAKGIFSAHFHPMIPFLSNLSYALYLTHMESFRFSKYLGIEGRNFNATILSLVIILINGCLLYFLVEKPFMKLREKVI